MFKINSITLILLTVHFIIHLLLDLKIWYYKCGHSLNNSHRYMITKLKNTNLRPHKAYLRKKIFPKKLCIDMIKEAEIKAERLGWQTARHSDYPTTDLELTLGWKCIDRILPIVYYDIIPYYTKIFKWKGQFIDRLIQIKELFIVKYDEWQNSLKEHKDGNLLSFVVKLNDDFVGGGTRFKNNSMNDYGKMEIGDCLLFCGLEKHSGIPVTSGTRYILTGFLDIAMTCHENDCNCTEHFCYRASGCGQRCVEKDVLVLHNFHRKMGNHIKNMKKLTR